MFSAILLVFSLLNSISIAAASESLSEQEKEKNKLEIENRCLTVECENRLSLEEIESYAEEVLGMRRCSPEQIIDNGISG